MTTPIHKTKTYREWYAAQDDQKKLDRKVDLLAASGVALGFPHTSTTSVPGIRELRIEGRGRDHVRRVYYSFEPDRSAVLLLGWDKKGEDTPRNRERTAEEAARVLLRWRAGGER